MQFYSRKLIKLKNFIINTNIHTDDYQHIKIDSIFTQVTNKILPVVYVNQSYKTASDKFKNIVFVTCSKEQMMLPKLPEFSNKHCIIF